LGLQIYGEILKVQNFLHFFQNKSALFH